MTSLEIFHWDFQYFQGGHIDFSHIDELFTHFGRSVKTLKLVNCCLDSEVLISLTSLFPHLNNLWLDPSTSSRSKPHRTGDYGQLKSVQFQGNLNFKWLLGCHEKSLAFVNKNSSDVHSISVQSCEMNGELRNLFHLHGPHLLSVGVGSKAREGKSTPRLFHHIISLMRYPPDIVHLSLCTQIRQLLIDLMGTFEGNNPNWDVLHTVNSFHLEEIDVYHFIGKEVEGSPGEWADIDYFLCQWHKTSRATSLHLSLHPRGFN